ncbi:hypothetical protein LZ31DRAFT_104610 [Colletotrichum somersetense]|nr:hypothetical protein LZ31DRAFT_104610 [Colletotrichum somersetense]
MHKWKGLPKLSTVDRVWSLAMLSKQGRVCAVYVYVCSVCVCVWCVGTWRVDVLYKVQQATGADANTGQVLVWIRWPGQVRSGLALTVGDVFMSEMCGRAPVSSGMRWI